MNQHLRQSTFAYTIILFIYLFAKFNAQCKIQQKMYTIFFYCAYWELTTQKKAYQKVYMRFFLSLVCKPIINLCLQRIRKVIHLDNLKVARFLAPTIWFLLCTGSVVFSLFRIYLFLQMRSFDKNHTQLQFVCILWNVAIGLEFLIIAVFIFVSGFIVGVIDVHGTRVFWWYARVQLVSRLDRSESGAVKGNRNKAFKICNLLGSWISICTTFFPGLSIGNDPIKPNI